MRSLMLFIVLTVACCFAQDAPLTGDLYNCTSSKTLGLQVVQNCNAPLGKNSFYHLVTPDGHEYVFVRKWPTDRMMGRVTYTLDGDNKITVYWYHAPDSGGLPYDHPLFTKTLIH